MLAKWMAPLALVTLLAACGGANPLGEGIGGAGDDDEEEGGGGLGPGTGGGGGSGTAVPASVAKNLAGASYSGGASTIQVTLRSQDAAAASATYTRDAAFDVAGYQAYTYQETTSNRFAVALIREVGSVKAAAVVDGGQFANYFGGGTFARSGGFSSPSNGVGANANYSGDYAGLLNTGIAAPGGPGGILNPVIPDRTTGRVLITADFTDNSLSGAVDNRSVVRTGTALAPIALDTSAISSTGTFAGKVLRLSTSGEFQPAGDYAGLFGSNGGQIASLLVFNPVEGQNLLFEHGVIVLPSCTTGGGPACP